MKLFNLLFLFNFVERITIPPAICTLVPAWKKSSPGKKHSTEKLPTNNQPQAESLNRRHCGQSQQSAVLRQKTRQTTSKILGLERKKLAKPKKSKRQRA